MANTRETLSRTQRDLQRLTGRRGPKEKRAVLWDEIGLLMDQIAANAQASGGAFASAIGATGGTGVDPAFQTQILAALAADQAALDAVNTRVDNALTYTENLVQLARDDLGGAISDVEAALAGLNTRFDAELPGIAAAQDQVDDLYLSLAWLAARIQDTDQRIADAGIYIDPENGAVRIAAIEQTESRLNAAEISVDALAADVTTRVTSAEMNQAISEALLDPTKIPILDELDLRLSSAEESLSAAEAAITERATLVDFQGLNGRLTTAESDISALEGSITTFVTNTEFEGLETRVTSAEQTITAIDAASITQVVYDTRSNSEELDLTALNSLEDLLTAYLEREAIREDVAVARQEIAADVTDTGEAIAAARLELGALVADNTALITSESVARADADSAISGRIDTLESTVNGNAAAITSEAVARADADGAISGRIDTLEASFGDVGLISEANIVAELLAQADADTALAGQITSLESDLNGVQSSVTTQAAAISTLESYASATYTIRLNAGGASAGLEIVAADDPVNGPVSAFRFHADAIIFDGTIYGQHIAADSINAEHINVSSLSAISATLGTFQSAPSGERLVIEGDRLTVYDSNNVVRVRLGRLS